MTDFEKLGVFYLGRPYDVAARKPKDGLVLYESKDLVTHAVCVGMTGSGKTGLCLALLEEAALDHIPAIIIDPKGDLGNLLLTFPDLRPADFLPWINEDDARRQGLSSEDYARQQAELWQKGLAAWGEDGARIRRLRESADLAIYTPGSNAGLPLSILKSFDAPPAQIRDDAEALREQVGVTATSLLGLLGIDADPIRSREHILISTILEGAWREGRDLDIADLIHSVQKPPVTRVGVLELEAFFPAADRFELATALNNLLASPGFAAWMEGEPLDPAALLHTPEGKPRLSIISIAHLGDAERMFFVTLLLNQVTGWMRRQSGTTSLRAILYMDEIFGFFPPVANPPSKQPLLTLLKQARAYGLGVVLATQNPVDLDYKGLSNAGTWFLGRLQTERDKARVLEGLEGAVTGAGQRFDRNDMDRILSGLGTRIFLMHNVHEDAPETFESRWAMSYLRGPLTREQISRLMAPRKGAAPKLSSSAAAAAPARGAPTPSPRPVLSAEIPEHFVPVRAERPADAALIYEPMLLGVASVRVADTKRGVDTTRGAVRARSHHRRGHRRRLGAGRTGRPWLPPTSSRAPRNAPSSRSYPPPPPSPRTIRGGAASWRRGCSGARRSSSTSSVRISRGLVKRSVISGRACSRRPVNAVTLPWSACGQSTPPGSPPSTRRPAAQSRRWCASPNRPPSPRSRWPSPWAPPSWGRCWGARPSPRPPWVGRPRPSAAPAGR